MRAVDVGYLAGIIDGEGCISIDNRTLLRLRVGMTDLDVIQNLHSLVGLGSIQTQGITGVRTKPYYTWNVSKANDVSSILMTIYPLVSARRKQKIKEALLVWRNHDSTRNRDSKGRWAKS